MDYDNINELKLEGKYINQIAYLLYVNQKDYCFINKIIIRFSLENLIKTNNNGIISNLLQYYISNNDNKYIEYIIESSNNLMKRDYLNLINYYYKTDIDKSIHFFENNIISQISINTNYIILSKDIDFIIENKLFKILEKLEGIFIETSNTNYPLVNNIPSNIKLKYITSDINKMLVNEIENQFSNKIKQNLENFMKKQTSDFGAIIDGANIIHARNGLINNQSIDDLKNLIINITETINNPIVIIHFKYFKMFPFLFLWFKSFKINYYLTPYGINDDLFIIWFFLKTNTQAFIISNDKFRDHIFIFETNKKKLILEFNLNQFCHIIYQQTLKYNIQSYKINKQTNISRCIQIDNNNIYIPYIKGDFIQITL
jgi:hypothetical protein